jgi:hypothetical protein
MSAHEGFLPGHGNGGTGRESGSGCVVASIALLTLVLFSLGLLLAVIFVLAAVLGLAAQFFEAGWGVWSDLNL